MSKVDITVTLRGDSIPENLRGQSFTVTGYTTASEWIKSGKYADEAAIAKALAGQFVIATNKLRTDLANAGKTAGEIRDAMETFTVSAETAPRKGNPEALEKARATREAQKAKAGAMDALAEAAANDPELAAKMRALGVPGF